VIMVVIEGQCIRCKARKTLVNPAVVDSVLSSIIEDHRWVCFSMNIIITTSYKTYINPFPVFSLVHIHFIS